MVRMGDEFPLEKVHSALDFLRSDYRERVVVFLESVGLTGRSLSLDFAAMAPPRIIRRFSASAEDAGLLRSQSLPVPGSAISLRAFWLSEAGRAFVKECRVQPVESDFERLFRLHDAARQDRHAALILLTAYFARKRNWRVEIAPFEPGQRFRPDMRLTDENGLSRYVECETRSRVKPEKWKWMEQINLVLPKRGSRLPLVARLKKAGTHGRATDLSFLRDGGEFWAETW